MKLYIMRHGIAGRAHEDAARELTHEGISGVKSVVQSLVREGVSLSRIVHSELVRAQQTAGHVIEGVRHQGQAEVWDCLKPCDPIQPAVDLILSHRVERPHKNLMLVGHLPFVGELTRELTGVSIQFGEAFVAELEAQKEYDWQLQRVFMPNHLAC